MNRTGEHTAPKGEQDGSFEADVRNDVLEQMARELDEAKQARVEQDAKIADLEARLHELESSAANVEAAAEQQAYYSEDSEKLLEKMNKASTEGYVSDDEAYAAHMAELRRDQIFEGEFPEVRRAYYMAQNVAERRARLEEDLASGKIVRGSEQELTVRADIEELGDKIVDMLDRSEGQGSSREVSDFIMDAASEGIATSQVVGAEAEISRLEADIEEAEESGEPVDALNEQRVLLKDKLDQLVLSKYEETLKAKHEQMLKAMANGEAVDSQALADAESEIALLDSGNETIRDKILKTIVSAQNSSHAKKEEVLEYVKDQTDAEGADSKDRADDRLSGYRDQAVAIFGDGEENKAKVEEYVKNMESAYQKSIGNSRTKRVGRWFKSFVSGPDRQQFSSDEEYEAAKKGHRRKMALGAAAVVAVSLASNNSLVAMTTASIASRASGLEGFGDIFAGADASLEGISTGAIEVATDALASDYEAADLAAAAEVDPRMEREYASGLSLSEVMPEGYEYGQAIAYNPAEDVWGNPETGEPNPNKLARENFAAPLDTSSAEAFVESHLAAVKTNPEQLATWMAEAGIFPDGEGGYIENPTLEQVNNLADQMKVDAQLNGDMFLAYAEHLLDSESVKEENFATQSLEGKSFNSLYMNSATEVVQSSGLTIGGNYVEITMSNGQTMLVRTECNQPITFNEAPKIVGIPFIPENPVETPPYVPPTPPVSPPETPVVPPTPPVEQPPAESELIKDPSLDTSNTGNLSEQVKGEAPAVTESASDPVNLEGQGVTPEQQAEAIIDSGIQAQHETIQSEEVYEVFRGDGTATIENSEYIPPVETGAGGESVNQSVSEQIQQELEQSGAGVFENGEGNTEAVELD